MDRCKDCGTPDATYEIYGGGNVCEACIGSYFTCPDCQKLYYRDDYEHGDSGSGFCSQCASSH